MSAVGESLMGEARMNREHLKGKLGPTFVSSLALGTFEDRLGRIA